MTFERIKAQLIRQGHLWERCVKQHGYVSSVEAKHLLGVTLRHLYRLIGKSLFPMRRNGRLYFQVSEIARARRERQVRKQSVSSAKSRRKGGDCYAD